MIPDLRINRKAEGVRRITAGKGVDIVIESIGGTVTSEALSSLGGALVGSIAMGAGQPA